MNRIGLALGFLLAATLFAGAIDFPSSPSTGQVYTFGNKTYIYNGSGWDISNTGLASPVTTTHGGTGQTTAPEAVGENTQALGEDTTPTTHGNYYTPAWSAKTGKAVKLRLDKVGTWNLVTSGTATGVSTLDLPLDQQYEIIRIYFFGATNTSSGASYESYVSQNGGSTFLNGAADYAWSGGYDCKDISAAIDCGNGSGDVTDNGCYHFNFMNNTAGRHVEMYVTVYNPVTATYPMWDVNLTFTEDSGTDQWSEGGADCILNDTTTADIDYIRIGVDFGTFTTDYAVYGYRK